MAGAARRIRRRRIRRDTAAGGGGGGGGRDDDDRGALLVAFGAEFGRELEALTGAAGERLRADPKGCHKRLKAAAAPGGKLHHERMKRWVCEWKGGAARRDEVEVGAFSRYLARYQRSEAAAAAAGLLAAAAEARGGGLGAIELPGQYGGDAPPTPSAHVTIESVGTTMRRMESLRQPKVVRLRGSDQREYPFLCKGGEDLRLDQRVEALFGAMNGALAAHAPAAARQLTVATYAVLPLSPQVGLIEWVGGTTTLKRLVHDEARARQQHAAAAAAAAAAGTAAERRGTAAGGGARRAGRGRRGVRRAVRPAPPPQARPDAALPGQRRLPAQGAVGNGRVARAAL